MNYERSAKVGDEIGGHNVSGHVHTKATICEVEDSENNRKVGEEVQTTTPGLKAPPQFSKFDCVKRI